MSENTKNKTSAGLNTYTAFNGSVAVITRNRSEYLYLHALCEDSGWLPPTLTQPDKYPFVVCLDFENSVAMWTDRLDRILNYLEFADFIAQNTRREPTRETGEKL